MRQIKNIIKNPSGASLSDSGNLCSVNKKIKTKKRKNEKMEDKEIECMINRNGTRYAFAKLALLGDKYLLKNNYHEILY